MGGPLTVDLASAQSGSGGDWQVSVSPYLWLPGVHGTVGAFDRDAGVSASPIDLLSHFRFGLMGDCRRSLEAVSAAARHGLGQARG